MVPRVADLEVIALRNMVMGELEGGSFDVIPMVLQFSQFGCSVTSDSLRPHGPMVLMWDKNPNNPNGLIWWFSGKEPACNAGASDGVGSIPALGRSPGEGNGNPFQCYLLENSMDRGAWLAKVWGHKESDTSKRLSTDST